MKTNSLPKLRDLFCSTRKTVVTTLGVAVLLSAGLGGTVYAANTFENGTLAAYTPQTASVKPWPADSVIAGGMIYAQELFMDGTGPAVLPSAGFAGAVFTVDGNIDRPQIEIKFDDPGITGAQFQDMQLGITGLNCDTDGNPNTPAINGSGDPTKVTVIKEGAQFKVDLAAAGAADVKDKNCILTSARFYLIYTLKQATGLNSTDGKVVIPAYIRDVQGGLKLAIAADLTVAKSKPALTTLKITKEEAGVINLTTDKATYLTRFTDNGTGGGGAYISSTVAQLGFLSISKTPGVKNADGKTEFALGDDTNATLVITGGQFSASVPPATGNVSLVVAGDPPTTIIIATDPEPTSDSVTFILKKDDLNKIADKSPVPIRLTVDGKTVINLGDESGPKATLTININATASLPSVEGFLRKIRPEGTECWVYNVPQASPVEKFFIRVTNTSNSPVDMTGTMYSESDGTMNGLATLYGSDGAIRASSIGVNETVVFTPESLKDAGLSWTGRGTLKLFTPASRVEVFALTRRLEPNGGLSNLSAGATGDGCSKVNN